MREIKFRIWDKKFKQMLDWEFLKNCYCDKLNNNEYKIMQYTGLLDKNGKEIYEGDILNFKAEKKTESGYEIGSYDYHPENAKVVEFKDGAFYAETDLLIKLLKWSLIEYQIQWRAIGNIYENPELVKNEQ